MSTQLSGNEASWNDTHADGATASRWERFEALIERAGERLNPILVKEARQALKSNQFLITFTLLLACGWGWSLLGVMLRMPEIQWLPSGSEMMTGYFLVLIVPMFIIVPFAAFRSLAAEREDGTFELMSITNLTARQIVVGKLCSSVLQMMVYYSALSPCIAFTYLLRGIDVITICFILYYTLVISVMLSIFGLLVATLTRARHWQVLLSVVLIVILFIVTWIWAAFTLEAVLWRGSLFRMQSTEFWLVQAVLLTVYGSFAVLGVQAAAARITFASDNRSTAMRITILVQFAMYAGWWLGLMTMNDQRLETEGLSVCVMMASLYAGVVGALLIGESPQLSPRVIRTLPVSVLGRIARAAYSPGSGTGYVFIIGNLLGLFASICSVGLYYALSDGLRGMLGSSTSWFWCSWLSCCYVAAYLGVVRLMVVALRRVANVTLALSLLLCVLAVTAGSAIPLIGNGMLVGFMSIEYSFLQVTNCFWTLTHAVTHDMWESYPEVVITLTLGATIIGLVNLGLTSREMLQGERLV